MVFMKAKNRRKFDSIVFAFLLQRYLSAHHPQLFADFMLCVDSDTQLVERADAQSIRQMTRRFQMMPEVIAACGETCVANIDDGVISKSQARVG
jgi:hypothetical protein